MLPRDVQYRTISQKQYKSDQYINEILKQT